MDTYAFQYTLKPVRVHGCWAWVGLGSNQPPHLQACLHRIGVIFDRPLEANCLIHAWQSHHDTFLVHGSWAMLPGLDGEDSQGMWSVQKAFQQNQNGFKVDNATILSATATVPQSSSVTCTYGSLAGECVGKMIAETYHQL